MHHAPMRVSQRSPSRARAPRLHWSFFAAWAMILSIRILGLDAPQGVMILLGAVVLISAAARVPSLISEALRSSLNEHRDSR